MSDRKYSIIVLLYEEYSSNGDVVIMLLPSYPPQRIHSFLRLFTHTDGTNSILVQIGAKKLHLGRCTGCTAMLLLVQHLPIYIVFVMS